MQKPVFSQRGSYVNPIFGSLLSNDKENQPITSLKFYTNCHDVIIYLDFLFSAGSGLDRPNLGCFHYLERVPGLAMYGLVSM